MTKKRSEVERVAEAMYLDGFRSADGKKAGQRAFREAQRGTQMWAIQTNLLIAAKFHLRAVRRARGRTVGYVGVTLSHGVARYVTGGITREPHEDFGDAIDSDDGVSRVYRQARVVLIEKRRKRNG